LPELQRLAGELGISGTGRMRKGDLVAAISARQGGSGSPGDRPADSGPSGTDSSAVPTTAVPTSTEPTSTETAGTEIAGTETSGTAASAPPPKRPTTGGRHR